MGEKREKSEMAFEFLIGVAGLILVVLTKRGGQSFWGEKKMNSLLDLLI